MLTRNTLLVRGFFLHSEGMIHFFRGAGVGWLVGGCLLKINTFKNGNVTGFVSFQRCIHMRENVCIENLRECQIKN